jgi:hypothetical protein
MTKQEFKQIIGLFDKTYPKQVPLTTEQQGVFWMSLQRYTKEQVFLAFISHTEDKEFGIWKPQVPVNITKFLANTDLEIKSKFQAFFQHKEVKDDLAVKLYKQMGGSKLSRITQKEYIIKEKEFVEMYKLSKHREHYQLLTNDQKNKLFMD